MIFLRFSTMTVLLTLTVIYLVGGLWWLTFSVLAAAVIFL